MPRWTSFSSRFAHCPMFQAFAFRALRQGAARRLRRSHHERSVGLTDSCEARVLLAAITVDDSGGADYTTIGAAVSNAAAGDVITVNDGVYNETVPLQSIGAGGTLTIQAANPQQALWNDNGMAFTASSITGNFVISGFDLGNSLIDDVSGVITLHDNRFDNVSTGHAISAFVSGTIDTGLHVLDNQFVNVSTFDAIVARAGTSAGGSLDVVVDGNTFSGLTSEGLSIEETAQLSGGTLTARVTDNVFSNRTGSGTDISAIVGGNNSVGYFSSILIDNNRTNLGSAPAQAGDALWVDFDGDNTTLHLTVSNNNFNHHVSGIYLDGDSTENGGLFNSRLDGNTLANIEFEGIHLRPFSASGGSRTVWNSVVTGNTLTNINSSLFSGQAGIEIEVDNPSSPDYTLNLDLDGNNVSMANGSSNAPFVVDANATSTATVNIERDIASNNTGAVTIDDPGMIVTMPSANAVTDSNEVRTISGFVFNDSNQDGNQTGEVGVGGVPVTLTGTQAVGGSVNLTTYTDINGNYSFPSVVQPSGAGYTLTVGTTPELSSYTLQNAVADHIDSDVNPTNGQFNVMFVGAGPAIDVDAGLYSIPDPSIDGTSGNDTFDVSVDGTELVVELNSTEVFRQALSVTDSLTLNGLDGNDTFNIDHSGGVVDLPINVAGGAPSGISGDVLSVSGGSFTNVTYDFTNASDGTIDYDGTLITYTGLEPSIDTSTAMNRTFEFNGAAETIQLSNSLGDGEMVIDSTLGASMAFAAPTDTLRIDSTTGTGADGIEILELDGTFTGNLTIVGDSDSGEEDSVTIESNALSIGAGNLSVTASQILLGNDITTSSGTQTFTGAVQLTDDVQLNSTGGAITFVGTVDADLESNTRILAIDSGSGAVEFQQTIGGSEALGSLSVNSTSGTGAITVGNIGTSMDAGITGETTFGNSSETASLLLEGVNYNTSGNQIYRAGSGQEILIDAEAAVSFVATEDTITFTRTVRLGDGSDLTINAGVGSGTIVLLSGVRGTSDETVDVAANVVQLGQVGSGNEILSVQVTGVILDLRGNIVTSSTASGNLVSLGSSFTQLQVGGNDITIDTSAGNGDISIGTMQGGQRNLTLNAGDGDVIAGGQWGLPNQEMHTVAVTASTLTLRGGIVTAARDESGTDAPGNINLNVDLINFTASSKFTTTDDTGGSVADGTLNVFGAPFDASGFTTIFDVGTTDLVLSNAANNFGTLDVTANTATIVDTNSVTISAATIGATTGTGLDVTSGAELHVSGAVTTSGSDVDLTATGNITTPGGANAFAITGGTVALNGDVAPGASPGDLVIDGDVTFNGSDSFEVDINGATPGTGYDQVRVTGANRTVTLNGVTLSASIGGGYEPAEGVQIVLIDNVEASSTVSGTFAGLAEGDSITIDGYVFLLSYADGTDGNDVTLTLTSSPSLSTQNFNAAENQTAIGTVVATDADSPNDTVTFSLTGGGADAGLFSITAGGVLTFDSAPDYEALADANMDNVYEVEVQAADSYGNSTTATMLVTVTDVNEAATLSVTNVTSTISQDVNNANRIFVESVNIIDADAGMQQNNLSLTGADAGLFEIVGNQVFLIANAGLDASSNPDLDVQVVLDDPTLGSGPEATADLSMTVTDPNANPLPALGSSFIGMTNGNWWLGRPDANGDYDTAIAVETSFAPNNIAQSFQGDFTGDGLEDTAILLTNGQLYVGAATQNGEFVFSLWTTLRTYGIKTLQVGDFNADGMADIVGAFESGSRARLWVFESTGTEFLPDEYRLYNDYAGLQTMLVGDFDGINGDDLAILNDTGVWWVAKSDIAGTEFLYGESWGQWDASRTITNFNVGDFNGDNVDDILGVFDIPLDPNRQSVVVGLSNGGGFDSAVWRKVPTDGSLNAFLVGDFDGDDSDDFALLDNSGNWRTGLADPTNGRFIDADWGMAMIGGSISTISVGDTNADGIADILVRNDTNRWQSAESTGSAFNTRVIEQWSPTASWYSVQIGSFAAAPVAVAGDVAETEEVFGDERILDLLYGS
ncbi:beta strand repeat-containing protein [Rubinisphaera margarita]|uniref:beta strand repeat-containing protein n=1 Tax=Rubinisphaera margarita TaxID=2909586 RepID=UPI001EE89AE8|nr:cadherin domain-containing protein [Rubinisphaera margarita]MCG6156588.1 cadherin domain-containing protein [Rubinisphaera margarita]